ncbi:MAG: hypothetical protein HY804_11320 [Nitrospinae bacterium]|nr:hypothetical protein [Nitrospinota bacterium]
MIKRYLFVLGLSIFTLVAFATVAAAKKPQFLGVMGCKCHKDELDEWTKSPHGNAYKVLLEKERSKAQHKAMRAAGLDFKKDYNKDEKCLPCHTVGFGEPGGYQDEKSAEDLRNVGCEMCHGAGSEYAILHKEKGETFKKAEAAALGEIYPPKEDVCRKCHDHKDSPFNSKTDKKYMFNFEEMIKLNKAWHKKFDLKFKHE